MHTFPYAGTLAKVIFAVGILDLGLLAVPVFAASASYALAETFGWREGLSLTFKQAPQFYMVIALATLVGLAFNLVGVNPIKALVFAAVINGVVAAPLILLIQLIGNNRRIMGSYVNGWLVNLVGLGHVCRHGSGRHHPMPHLAVLERATVHQRLLIDR